MGTACLPSESLLTGGPRGGWCFRKGWRGPAPCLKAFPRMVIEGRFIWKELVSARGQAPLGTSAWTGFLWVCAGSHWHCGPSFFREADPGLARWVSADLRGLLGKGQLPCAVCQAVLPPHMSQSYLRILVGGGIFTSQNRKPEAQRGQAACPRSHRTPLWWGQRVGNQAFLGAHVLRSVSPLRVEMCRREWAPSSVSCVFQIILTPPKSNLKRA